MINLTKHQFKICEAVHLKMDYYYMGPKDKRKLTDNERKEAARLLPQLPQGWMNEEQEWFLHKIPKKKLKDEIIED
jgi:hypothetical protein